MSDISIIIPFHRNKKMLLTSLKTLKESLEKPVEIIVVANNINIQEIQLDLNPRQYKLLQFGQNLFYPEAVRQGALAAGGKYLILADPDIFYCENWLSQMLTCFASHDNVGGVGAKLVNPLNNRVLDFGIGYQGYHTLHPFRGLPYAHELCNEDICVQSICSALFLIEHSMLESFNYFDSEMPYAYCDNDLCLRLSESGYQIWGAAQAVAYHKGSTDTMNSKYYAFRHLRDDCTAAFFSKNHNRYFNDYSRFLNTSTDYYLSKKSRSGYIFVNLSSLHDWKAYMELLIQTGFTILDTSECLISQRNSNYIDLFNTVDSTLLDSKTPLIYFVDSFVSCYDNSLWFSLRNIEADIIIDCNANCIPCWQVANNLI